MKLLLQPAAQAALAPLSQGFFVIATQVFLGKSFKGLPRPTPFSFLKTKIPKGTFQDTGLETEPVLDLDNSSPKTPNTLALGPTILNALTHSRW